MKKLIAVSLTVAIGAATCASASFAADTNGISGQSAQEPLGSRSAPGDTNDVKGEFNTGSTPTGDEPDGGVAPSSDSGAAPNSKASLPSTDPESAAQGASGSQKASLPFTGYLAIPVLLLGSLLLVAGVTLRRRATPGSTA